MGAEGLGCTVSEVTVTPLTLLSASFTLDHSLISYLALRVDTGGGPVSRMKHSQEKPKRVKLEKSTHTGERTCIPFIPLTFTVTQF